MLSVILKGGTLSLFRQVLSLIVSLYTFSIVTNSVSPSEFGLATVSILSVTILALVLTWSYNGVLIKNIAFDVANNAPTDSLFKFNYAIVNIFLCILLIFLIYLFCFGFELRALLLSLLLVIVILDLLFSAILSGYQLYIKSDWANLFQPIVFFVLFKFFADNVNADFYIFYYLCSLFASLSIKALIVFLCIDNDVFLFRKNNFLKLYRESTSVFLANAMGMCVYRLHYFIISIFLGSSYLGIFAFSQQIVEKFWLLSSAYASVIYPVLSRRNLSENKKVIKQILRLTLLMSFFISLATVFFGVVPDRYFTIVFNESYLPSKDIILLMSLGIGGWAGVKVIASIFSSLGLFKYNLFVSLVTVLVSSVLVLLFSLFNYQLIGLGIGVGYLVGFIVSLTKIKKIIGSEK